MSDPNDSTGANEQSGMPKHVQPALTSKVMTPSLWAFAILFPLYFAVLTLTAVGYLPELHDPVRALGPIMGFCLGWQTRKFIGFKKEAEKYVQHLRLNQAELDLLKSDYQRLIDDLQARRG